MRHPAVRFPRSRHVRSLVPGCRAAWLAGLSWTGRGVALWAVLAGLFLMHGAASPAACTQGGAPVMAMALVTLPAMPAAASAPGRAAAPAGQAGTSAAAPPAAGPALGSSCGGMLCSTRQPRDALAGLSLIPLAALVVRLTVPARARLAAVFRLAWRPPGRPGLPLPLFLGVSRT